MKRNLIRGAQLGAVLLFVGASGALVRAAATPSSDWRTVNILQTNRNARVITNLIEVRVPHNVFVDEHRTNWFPRTLTNIVEVAVTNWSKKTVTNTLLVDAFQTNIVARYQTNWITLFQTNRTTLTLTNWETVVVTKTNWIRQPMTNVIEVSLPVNTVVAARETPTQPEAKTEVPPAESKSGALVLEALKTARPLENNGVEVQFNARLSNEAATPLQVQWRVERDDGAVLFFAQTQEFKRVLPTGRYQILVKARRDVDSPLLTLQSGIDVTRDQVARR